MADQEENGATTASLADNQVAPGIQDAAQLAKPPILSKNQQKKLMKRELYLLKAKQKKAEEKTKRQEQQEKKKADAQAALAAMSEEELTAWKARRLERSDERRRQRDARRSKLENSQREGQRIILDLDFSHLMSEGEIRSMAQQLNYCYSVNSRAPTPAHLIFTGMSGPVGQALRKQTNGIDNWLVTMAEESYLEHFEGKKEELVYLTADSPNELTELDPKKAYIIGGLVDRNRHKGICFDKAVAQGVETARLPIGEYIQLASSPVMCTNHVVDMLVKWLEVKNWEQAFKAVVPTRKRKAEDAVDGEEGAPAGKEEVTAVAAASGDDVGGGKDADKEAAI